MKVLLYGFAIGLIVPIFGLFIGLQVSSTVGDTLLFPIYLFSSVFDEPFGMLSVLQKSFLFMLSGCFYACILFLIDRSAQSTIR